VSRQKKKNCSPCVKRGDRRQRHSLRIKGRDGVTIASSSSSQEKGANRPASRGIKEQEGIQESFKRKNRRNSARQIEHPTPFCGSSGESGQVTRPRSQEKERERCWKIRQCRQEKEKDLCRDGEGGSETATKKVCPAGTVDGT